MNRLRLRFRLHGILMLLLSATVAEANAALTLDEALAAANEQHPAIRTAEQRFLDLLHNESERCQQRLLLQATFTPPATTCSLDYFLDPIQRQQLVILRRMFDVSLADERAGLENEALATAFIDYDRTQTRMEQGQRSEIDVAEMFSLYQPVRVDFYASERGQRQSRVLLAMARGQPDELISDISLPDFTQWLASPPGEQKPIIAAVLEKNPVLQRAREQGDAAFADMLAGQLQSGVLELLLSLEVMGVKQEAARADVDYRNLYLDRSRTLYELEVKADLGDSMVEQTRARLHHTEVTYERVMLRALLNGLQGRDLLDGLQMAKENDK